MAITANLTVTPAAPNHGDTVTATYTVQGNDPTPAQSASVSGDVSIGGQDLQVSTTVTLPGAAPLPETFAVPTCPGLAFEPTAQPNVFTAIVP